MTYNIKVVFSVPSGEDWNAIIWDHIKTAIYPQQLRFGVLVECESISDAERDVDPLLRSMTNVDYVLKKKITYALHRRVRLLSRTFIVGDETVVLVLDWRARLLTGFDQRLTSLCSGMDSTTLVSIPSRRTDERGHFPCLFSQQRRRNVSLPFRLPSETLVPSVCVCSEVMFAHPNVFQGWKLLDTFRLMCTPAPLVVDDKNLEYSHIEEYHPPPDGQTTRCETVGIVDSCDDEERILKFGSARAGKLAIRFGYKSICDGA